MATWGGEWQQGEGEAVSSLTCGVCQGRYRRPKLLPCLHTYCQTCLQAVAGTAPSFPCPACRAPVLLPPGGIPALQTNHYIEREQDMDSTAPAWLCDVCSEDREATHSCLHCHQRYCGPCRNVHDSISSSRAHTVVPVQAESLGDGDLQWGDPCQRGQEELCPKHDGQPLVLHCEPCGANICLRCKLTAHKTHSVENLQDIGSKVKARLRERLQALDHQASTLQGVLSVVRDRRDRLIAAHTSTEQGITERALKVKQLVDTYQDNTVGSLHALNKDLMDSLSATEEGLRRRHAAVTAQTEHITRVLRADKDTDIVDLEARLNEMSLDPEQGIHSVSILQKEAEPYLCEHNPLAIGAAQLQEFVGVLKMLDDKTADSKGDSTTPGPSETLTPGQPQSVSWSAQQSVTIQEVVYSRNPKSTVVAICSTPNKEVWVKYMPDGENEAMALFGRQGLQKKIDGDFPSNVIVAVPFWNPRLSSSASTIVGLGCDFCFVDLFGSIRYRPLIVENHKLRDQNVSSAAKTCRWFRLYASDGYKCFMFHFHVPLLAQTFFLAFSMEFFSSDNITQTDFPSRYNIGHLKDVSKCEKYFVFEKDDGAQVYSKSRGGLQKMSRYNPAPTHKILDACFFPVGGREVLVVLVEGDRQLHVVDHTDGCYFLQYLDTGHFSLHSPRLLATDQESALWVACDGGKLLSIQITSGSWCTVM